MLKNRPKILITIALSAIPILLLAMSADASRNLKTGDKVPDFTLQDTDGKDFSFASLSDKISVIAFWRSGQERSMQALVALQGIYAEFKEQGVEVLALSSDKDGLEAIGEVKQSKQLTFTMLHDKDQKVYGDYGIIGIPSTFVIDKEGKLSYYYPGYRSDYPRQIKGHLEVLLGKKTAEQLESELKPNEKPDISEAEKKARRYMNAGNRLLEKRMLRLAMVQFQKAAQEAPDLIEPHLHLGDIYLAQKKTEEAAAEFGKAIELKPESAEAHAGMGDVLFLQGKLEGAEKMLQTALKLDPKLAKAHYSLGNIYEGQKRLEDALKEYKTALKILLKIEEEE